MDYFNFRSKMVDGLQITEKELAIKLKSGGRFVATICIGNGFMAPHRFFKVVNYLKKYSETAALKLQVALILVD